ncbi:hypothetical protein DFJ73DRAFT_784440 [Zopfochytrium polystomum]|nr:hypothetical protein DFJ73DRAFT_784440 [Zopfochytrium polystomum]
MGAAAETPQTSRPVNPTPYDPPGVAEPPYPPFAFVTGPPGPRTAPRDLVVRPTSSTPVKRAATAAGPGRPAQITLLTTTLH